MEQATIVVVEDDPHIADLLDLYLRQAGFRVLLAPNGHRGLELLESSSPRLLVLDLGLPGDLDGLEVCRRVRSRPATAALSTDSRPGRLRRREPSAKAL